MSNDYKGYTVTKDVTGGDGTWYLGSCMGCGYNVIRRKRAAVDHAIAQHANYNHEEVAIRNLSTPAAKS